MIREWTASGRGDSYARRRDEVQERFRQRLQEISTEYRNQTDPGEKYLDKLQREVLSRYQRTLAVQRTIQAEIDRRSRVEPPPTEKANEARQGTLVVSSAQSKYDLKVGEVADIDLHISGGNPPYKVWVKTQEMVTLAEMTLSEPGYFSFPVSFPKEGNYIVAITVEDDTPVTRNVAILNLQFRVTDDKPTAPEPPQSPKPPDPPKPPGTTKPQSPPQPPYVPWQLAPGNYEGHLFLPMDLFGPYRKGAYAIRIPYPVTFAIDAAGKITGRGEWHLNPRELNPAVRIAPNVEYKTDLSYWLEGQCDLATGAIRLRVADFLSVQRTIEREPAGDSLFQHDLEVEFELTGWQTGHPTLARPLIAAADIYRRLAVDPAAAADLEQSCLPIFTVGTDQRLVYRDRGWAGVPEMTGTDKNVKVSKGPGGESLVKVRKSVSWIEGGAHKIRRVDTESDNTAPTQKSWQGRPSTWFLKVLGQVPPPVQPPTPTAAPPAPLAGELAAFGLWPRGEMTARQGEAFELDAMGVLLNDPYEAVKLNDHVTWNLPTGLTRGPDGRLTAANPGTYTASVSIKRPDGRTMTDTIRITVK